MVATRGWGRREWGVLYHGYRISIWDDENVLDIDSRGVCIMPMNDALRANMINCYVYFITTVKAQYTKQINVEPAKWKLSIFPPSLCDRSWGTDRRRRCSLTLKPVMWATLQESINHQSRYSRFLNAIHSAAAPTEHTHDETETHLPFSSCVGQCSPLFFVGDKSTGAPEVPGSQHPHYRC